MTDNLINIESIIYELSVSQIDDLILELELKHVNNIRFHYIIDPYDLQKYCFPFGILDSVADKNIERENLSIPSIADEQIAYNNIFVKADCLCFILDEHYKEVIDFQKYYMHIQTMHGDKLVNTAKRLATFYEEEATIIDKIQTIDDIEPDDLSLLYSIAINSTYSGKEKFNNLVINKRIVVSKEELKFFNSIESEVLQDLFTTCKASELASYLNKLSQEYYNPENKNDAKVKIHLKSLDRDYRAIDRILKLNTMSIQKDLKVNNKPLFLYLSNTRMSKAYFQEIVEYNENDELKSFLKKINTTIKDSFSENFAKHLNPHRTPAQLYLQLLLESENDSNNESENYERTKSRLVYFRDFIANFRINNQNITKDQSIKYLNELIIKYRSNFDGYLLLEKHKEFRSNFNNTIKNRSFNSFKKLINNIQNLNELFETDKIDQKINEYINSSFWIISLSQVTKTFLTSLISRSKDRTSIRLRGKDKISSIFQALPIVFFYSNSNNNICYNNLNDFIDSLTEIHLNQSIIADNLLKKISIFEKYRNQEAINCFEDTAAIMNIIVLLLVDEHDSLHIDSYDLASRLIDYNLMKHNRNEPEKSNFLYLKAWINRRENKMEVARNISLDGKRTYPNDPRFVHSLALLDYCEFFNQDSKENMDKQINLIKASIKNFEVALKMYESKNSIKDSIRSKTKYAILNSISYSLALLFHLNNETYILQQSRSFLKKLKIELPEKEFDEISEFLHTEAYVEYQEALKLYRIEDFTKAWYKSSQALSEIIKAINKSTRLNIDSYWGLKDEIESLQELVRIRIK